MLQDQEIKGFTLLELLVVIVIVSVISAIGYPQFTSWKKDREIRYATEKVSNMMATINTQAQRGSFPFVQLWIKPTAEEVEFITKGQSPEQYNSNLNDGKTPDCATDKLGKFDTNEYEKYVSEEKTISIQTTVDKVATVCFSQNGTYFKKKGEMLANKNIAIEGRLSNNYIIICSWDNANDTSSKCATTKGDGLKKPAYLVEWSRFGNISKFKWSDGVWTRQ